MNRYFAKEFSVYKAVCKKYKVLLDKELQTLEQEDTHKPDPSEIEKVDIVAKVKAANEASVAEETMKEVQAARNALIKEHLVEIYTAHDKGKIAGLDKTIEKYSSTGNEEQLYQAVCNKYRVEKRETVMVLCDKAMAARVEFLQLERAAEIAGTAGTAAGTEAAAQVAGTVGSAGGAPASQEVFPHHQGAAVLVDVAEKKSVVVGGEKATPPGKKLKSSASEAVQLPGRGELSSAQLKKMLEDLYRTHAPDKLDNLPSVLSKYDGQEEDLYFKVCQKYKVAPQIKEASPVGNKKDRKSDAAKSSPAPSSPSEDADEDAPGAPSKAPGAEEPATGPFDADQQYLNYALEVLCVLLKGLASVCHIGQNLGLSDLHTQKLVHLLQKKEQLQKTNADPWRYTSSHSSFWDFTHLPPEQLRDFQVALRPEVVSDML